MIKLNDIFLPKRFFIVFMVVIAVFVAAYPFPILLMVGWLLLFVFFCFIIFDALSLFRKKDIVSVKRELPNMLSLGDENTILLHVLNRSSFSQTIEIIDELPEQLQDRDSSYSLTLTAGEEEALSYTIKPLSRGEYVFGRVHLYISSPIGLLQRRCSFGKDEVSKVYPSIIQLKKYELKSLEKTAQQYGLKKLRKIGHGYEFENIKNYVPGDDIRSINWKATSRRNSLMVNQYEDEKSQQVYALIDKSRAMKMPYNGMSLLDYAINSGLIIANTAIQKYDKPGIITFSNTIDNIVGAKRGRTQMKSILEALYKQKESMLEADYELLYSTIQKQVKGRSLLFLYTNFESLYALQRVLPVLGKINQLHLLVIMFFENTEIQDYSQKNPENLEGIYLNTIAEKFVYEKENIFKEISKYGIQVVINKPDELSINTINKYLELKSRGMI